MRKALAFIAAAMFLAQGAFAADLSYKNPPAPYAAPYSWTGFYVGGEFGYGVNQGDASGTFVTLDGGTSTTNLATKPQGFVGGGFAGYDFQASNIVFGILGNVDVATLDGTASNPGFIGNANSKNRALASIRGRLGYLLTPQALIYGTGGWGWSTADFTVTDSFGKQMTFSPTLSGAVLGGGLEYAFTQNWRAKVEYLHYFLNDINGAGAGTLNNAAGSFAFNAKENVDVVLGGINYKF